MYLRQGVSRNASYEFMNRELIWQHVTVRKKKKNIDEQIHSFWKQTNRILYCWWRHCLTWPDWEDVCRVPYYAWRRQPTNPLHRQHHRRASTTHQHCRWVSRRWHSNSINCVRCVARRRPVAPTRCCSAAMWRVIGASVPSAMLVAACVTYVLLILSNRCFCK